MIPPFVDRANPTWAIVLGGPNDPRALENTTPDHVFAVAPFAGHPLDDGRDAGSYPRLLREPSDRGSAASVLLALAHVLERDSDAMVTVSWPDASPSGGPGIPDPWKGAVTLARRLGRIVVVSAHGPSVARSHVPFDADGSGDEAVIVAASATSLWDAAREAQPDLARAFGPLAQVLRRHRLGHVPAEHVELAIRHVYEGLEPRAFVRDVLDHCGAGAVLRLDRDRVTWGVAPIPAPMLSATQLERRREIESTQRRFMSAGAWNG